MALLAVTAGAMAGTGQALTQLGLPAVQSANNLGERLLYAVPCQLANAGIRTVVNVIAGQQLKDTALNNLQYAAAGTVGQGCANQIGDAYAKGQIDGFTHKLLHAAVGARRYNH